jgi:hypothetical protein
MDTVWTIAIVAGAGVLLGFLYLGFARRVRRLGDLPQVDQNVQQRVDEDVSMWRRMQRQNTPWI